MPDSHSISMLGTGLIGRFYTQTLHDKRSKDRVDVVYSRTTENAEDFADEWDIPTWTTGMEEAIRHPDTDVVVIGLPNHLHEQCVEIASDAGKAILCTKPLARTSEEALRILETVEEAGVFHGYLEDLVYTPKTLKSIDSVQKGALGDVIWARSRETHSGPHSNWFWDLEQAGGGAIIDLGCHCIEIVRNFIGKDVRPIEAMCTADTLVHPIEAEDHGLGWIRFDNGAIGQFEVSWAFRGGMDLRDEVAGTEGTIWLNHFLRTGFEMFTSGESEGYVAEKAESESGWQFPVGDEVNELGYTHMFVDMFDAIDEGTRPMEDFYDGYLVNAIIDACYESSDSGEWEPIKLEEWRGRENVDTIRGGEIEYDGRRLVKKERMPDGSMKLILQDKESGEITQEIVEE